MNRGAVLVLSGCLAVAGVANAAEYSVHGFGDVRVIAPPSTRSYLDGGLGKLRFGEDDPSPTLKLGDWVAEGIVTEDAWTLQADGRLSFEYGTALDLTQGYIRYAPNAETQWRWAVRAGSFFPSISLENDQVGWSPLWTITPSAINSWIGAELRIIGAEGTVEWRSNGNDITLIGGVFGWNDTAGVLIAERGWNFDDRITGLIEKSRLPDAVARGRPLPLTVHLFREIDNVPGWYLDLSYEIDSKTGFEAMYYDNEADPSLPRAWHTSFWDLGFRQQLGPITLLSQAVSGHTVIRPSTAVFTATDFKAAYVLAGWDLDDVLLAARIDFFQTRTRTAAAAASPLSEDGHAFDATASWLLRRWLRLSAEFLLVEDTRAQRLVEGDAPHQTETQFQLVARAYF
jgi:hypothetical protein